MVCFIIKRQELVCFNKKRSNIQVTGWRRQRGLSLSPGGVRCIHLTIVIAIAAMGEEDDCCQPKKERRNADGLFGFEKGRKQRYSFDF